MQTGMENENAEWERGMGTGNRNNEQERRTQTELTTNMKQNEKAMPNIQGLFS